MNGQRSGFGGRGGPQAPSDPWTARLNDHRLPGVRARLVSHVRDVGRTPQAAGETTLLESQHVSDLPGRDQRLFTPPTVHFYLSGFHLDG